jgi:hypothetical protein
MEPRRHPEHTHLDAAGQQSLRRRRGSDSTGWSSDLRAGHNPAPSPRARIPMNPDDFSLALRIRHPSIDPAEITRQLGVTPQHAWRAGEPRAIEDDEAGSAFYRETYWVGLLPSRPLNPALAVVPAGMSRLVATHPQVALYFTLLKMKRAAGFWREFAQQGGTIECLLQIHRPERFQFDLSQALLVPLVDLKISLSIEVEGELRAAA